MDSSRLLGLDLARFLALVGMVVVHGWTDLVLLPLEQAGGALPDGPEGPGWAVALQSVATDRARPLFVLLAGVGVTLFTARTGAGPRVLLLRAAFLGVLGVLLLLTGWSDLVLVAYGVLFVLAVGLVRLPTTAVAGLAVAAWALPFVMVTTAPVPPDGGALPVLAEFGYFFAGVALGRLRLGEARTAASVGAAGLLTAVVAGAALVLSDGSLAGWRQPDSWAALAAETALTVGSLLAVLGGCLLVGRVLGPDSSGRRTSRGRLLAPLLVAGAMPLSVYVGHALLYPALAPRLDADLVTATVVGAVYLLVAVVAAQLWARAGRSGRPARRGPVETLMRRVSGPPVARQVSAAPGRPAA